MGSEMCIRDRWCFIFEVSPRSDRRRAGLPGIQVVPLAEGDQRPIAVARDFGGEAAQKVQELMRG